MQPQARKASTADACKQDWCSQPISDPGTRQSLIHVHARLADRDWQWRQSATHLDVLDRVVEFGDDDVVQGVHAAIGGLDGVVQRQEGGLEAGQLNEEVHCGDVRLRHDGGRRLWTCCASHYEKPV